MILKLINKPKQFLKIYLISYSILFLLVPIPEKNYLPILWMMTLPIFGIPAGFRTHYLYEYVKVNLPEHRASFDRHFGTISKKATEKDTHVKEELAIIGKLNYILTRLFFGFIVYHIIAYLIIFNF